MTTRSAKGGGLVRRHVWIVEGRWTNEASDSWSPIIGRGFFREKREAVKMARILQSDHGGCLYRATGYVPAAPKRKARKGVGG